MGNEKLINYELLKRYHGKSLAEIKTLLAEAEEVAISTTPPTNSGAKLWFDMSENESIIIPEIKDGEISAGDTWSSEKINDVMNTTVPQEVGKAIMNFITTKEDIDAMFAEEDAV